MSRSLTFAGLRIVQRQRCNGVGAEIGRSEVCDAVSGHVGAAISTNLPLRYASIRRSGVRRRAASAVYGLGVEGLSSLASLVGRRDAVVAEDGGGDVGIGDVHPLAGAFAADRQAGRVLHPRDREAGVSCRARCAISPTERHRRGVHCVVGAEDPPMRLARGSCSTSRRRVATSAILASGADAGRPVISRVAVGADRHWHLQLRCAGKVACSPPPQRRTGACRASESAACPFNSSW